MPASALCRGHRSPSAMRCLRRRNARPRAPTQCPGDSTTRCSHQPTLASSCPPQRVSYGRSRGGGNGRSENSPRFPMASGYTTRGMAQLEALGWVHEGKGHYIQHAAAAYLAATENGSRMNECIAVCPTWAENHRLTEAIRTQLKQRGVLEEGKKLNVHEPLDWTIQQR